MLNEGSEVMLNEGSKIILNKNSKDSTKYVVVLQYIVVPVSYLTKCGPMVVCMPTQLLVLAKVTGVNVGSINTTINALN